MRDQRISSANDVIVVPSLLERLVVVSGISAVRERSTHQPLWSRDNVCIFQSGMGSVGAARAADWLQHSTPRSLWLVGVCGGLSDHLQTGDVVLAVATLSGGNGLTHSLSDSLMHTLRRAASRFQRQVHLGPIFMSERPLATTTEKKIAAQSGAIAVEMEAVPLARLAHSMGIPFVHLRVVLDPHDCGPLVWSRRSEFFRELVRLRAVRQMWTAAKVLHGICRAMADPGGPFGTPVGT